LQIEADVRFLASDDLEGREAGSRGYDIAASYVAERFRATGLEPAGADGTFMQPVPLLDVSYNKEGKAELSLFAESNQISVTYGKDYVVLPNVRHEHALVEGSVVFGGYCIRSNEHKHDDFEGLALHGNIAACADGAPAILTSEERAYFGSRSTKNQFLSEAGVDAVIWLYTAEQEHALLPFQRLVQALSSSFSGMTWIQDDGSPFSSGATSRAWAVLSLDGAEKLFSSSKHSWAEVQEEYLNGEGNSHSDLELSASVRIEIDSDHKRISSKNVIGMIRGTDPALRDEYLLLTAHLDHIGIKPTSAVGDDEVNNGAVDNAAGVAVLLEVARQLSADPPSRSILFLAVTAEEKGLTGSAYYANNPTVSLRDIVATVNLDSPIPTYAFQDVVALGSERTTMHEIVKEAVSNHGVALSPDPSPELGLFTKSDQYSFVKQGIPAVFLLPGHANGGKDAWSDFLTSHLHQPSDEFELIDFGALRRFADIESAIARGIADMPNRPVWKTGDFFGETFGGANKE
jgi:hypothetical protein